VTSPRRLREPRWRKMKTREAPAVEALLRSGERCCMNACNRFINRKPLKGDAWVLHGDDGELSAVLVHARQALLPVRRGGARLPAPHFMRGIFGMAPLHSLQGRKSDVAIMEAEMEGMGLRAVEKVDFDLMCMDAPPGDPRAAGPAGLVTREPSANDIDSLVELHAAYEKEEVMSGDRELNPAASRMRMEQIFAREKMLVADLGGRLVGKINTNAATFTRYQIGGVYVRPDCRGMGIARRMAGAFVARLVTEGRGISLFVKKSNGAARQVYRNIGFEILDSYRINYYHKG